MKAWLVLVALAACSSSHAPGPGSAPGTGSAGGGAPPVTGVTSCEDVRPRVEQLYRAEAQAKEPERVDEAVADNTTMVMNDCAKDPQKRVPCLARAGTVAEIERECLIPLDDEGTEGAALAR